MTQYELTYLISPDLSQTEAEKESEQIIELLTEKGGSLINSKKPAAKRLAYPIKLTKTRDTIKPRKTSAFMGVITFTLDPAKIKEFKSQVSDLDNVLRTILITYDEKKSAAKPKPIRRRLSEVKPKISKEAIPEKVNLEEIEKKLEKILNPET